MPIKAKHGSHWISDKMRLAIYCRDAFTCAYCGEPTVTGRGPTGRSLDHIIPKSKGGTHLASNLVTAHISCNSARKNDELAQSLCERFLSIASKPLVLENGVTA